MGRGKQEHDLIKRKSGTNCAPDFFHNKSNNQYTKDSDSEPFLHMEWKIDSMDCLPRNQNH